MRAVQGDSLAAMLYVDLLCCLTDTLSLISLRGIITRNRALECAAATCPTPSTCHLPNWYRPRTTLYVAISVTLSNGKRTHRVASF